jgi:putative ABC transport system substrate-binding protein
MQRRSILHAAAVAVVAPRRLHAQQIIGGPMRRIAILNPGTEPGVSSDRRRGAAQLWASVGRVEGRNLTIERRYADGALDRLPELAAELLRHDPEVLIAYSDAAVAAARATRTVPIVALFVAYPVEQGLVHGFAEPGRNVTGFAWTGTHDIAAKRFQLMRELAPSATRLSTLGVDPYTQTISGKPLDVELHVGKAARAAGFEHVHHESVRRPEDVERALDEAAAARAQAILVSNPPYVVVRQRVAEFALRQRWLSATGTLDLLNAGLLLYHGPPMAEIVQMYVRQVQMTERILQGAKPADIPMEMPTRYELALNLKTARALGLAVPPSALLQADWVVE